MYQVKVFNKFLKFEGTVAQVLPRWKETSSTGVLTDRDTNILFIVGGAFDGLDEIITTWLKIVG